MRKIIVSLHTTLDGFLAGPKGEMDWIKLNDALFDFVGKLTANADTALYGRITYQMMESYWPNAGVKPNASKHDIEHSRWYNQVTKVVLSHTMQGKNGKKTTFIGGNILNEIKKLKQTEGKDILIFGSPSAVHSLMEYDLIDDFWLFVNPILLGKGIPLFERIKDRKNLELMTTKHFSCGVVGLHYALVT